MRSRIRTQLAAASRARDVCRAHPFEEEEDLKLVTDLDGLIVTGTQLALDESLGRKEASAATRQRQARRRDILADLKVVRRVGARADRQHEGIASKLQPPAGNSANAVFSTRCRAILQVIGANAEMLATYGLGAALVRRLTASLDTFDANILAGNAGRAAHVTAAGQLQTVSRQIVELIGILDAGNRIRFKEDDGLLAVWISARNGVTAEPNPKEPETPAAPEGPTTKAG